MRTPPLAQPTRLGSSQPLHRLPPTPARTRRHIGTLVHLWARGNSSFRWRPPEWAQMRGPRRIPQPARLAASARGRVAFVSLPVRVYLSVDAYGGDRRQSGLLRVNNETVARAENSAACRMAASWKLVGVHKLRPLEALSCARASCAACGCSADPDPPGAFERLAREWDHAR
mmetsp:Transcript_32721/g.97848  ORF Transcript_32721/g.97848 Transcript_32721/m.97848 type:complete len:172 (-) Transcript_32721:119-634(-)